MYEFFSKSSFYSLFIMNYTSTHYNATVGMSIPNQKIKELYRKSLTSFENGHKC